jgi:3-oxoadipate enol-lactonase
VFGTSLGGMIAQHVALLYPNRTRGLVLGCTTCGGPHNVLPTAETIMTFMAAGEISDPIAAVRSTFPMHYSDAFIASDGAELEQYALDTQHLRSSTQGRAGQSVAAARHDTYDRLPEIAAPTLVLHGEDDPLVRVENGRTLAERIPGAKLIVYPGAKHIFFVECAEQMNRDIIGFLSGVPARAVAT